MSSTPHSHWAIVNIESPSKSSFSPSSSSFSPTCPSHRVPIDEISTDTAIQSRIQKHSKKMDAINRSVRSCFSHGTGSILAKINVYQPNTN